MRTSLCSLALIGLAAACQSSYDSTNADHDSRYESMRGTEQTASEQIANGRQVFAEHCAKCHGKSAGGTDDAPKLVGTGALPLEPREGQERDARFHTAQDVVEFAMQNMPPKAADRAKLDPEAYWCVVAYVLDANGMELTRPLESSNAPAVMLHP